MKTQIPKIISGVEYLYNNPELGRGVAAFGAVFSMAMLFSCIMLYRECDRKLLIVSIGGKTE